VRQDETKQRVLSWMRGGPTRRWRTLNGAIAVPMSKSHCAAMEGRQTGKDWPCAAHGEAAAARRELEDLRAGSTTTAGGALLGGCIGRATAERRGAQRADQSGGRTAALALAAKQIMRIKERGARCGQHVGARFILVVSNSGTDVAISGSADATIGADT